MKWDKGDFETATQPAVMLDRRDESRRGRGVVLRRHRECRHGRKSLARTLGRIRMCAKRGGRVTMHLRREWAVMIGLWKRRGSGRALNGGLVKGTWRSLDITEQRRRNRGS